MPDGSEQTPPGASPEVRRRRREGWFILAAPIAVVLFAVFLTRMPPSVTGKSLGSDATLVLLINVSLIGLAIIVILVGRNIVKLILDRRARVLGSHLRTRLVAAFVGVALLPAGMLFTVALAFVGNSVENWFKGEVESALEGSLEVAHAYYDDLARTSLGFARSIAKRVAADGLDRLGRKDVLRKVLDDRRLDYQLDLVEVFAGDQVLARSRRADMPPRVGTEPSAILVRNALQGQEDTLVDSVGGSDMVRAAAPVMIDGRVIAAVVVDAWVPRSVRLRREEIDKSFRQYLQMKIQRRPIQTSYTITLALVTVVVLFAATWVAFAVARSITVPLQRLAEGTRAVAQGDLGQHIEGEGDDEVGTLVTSFNAMTQDLKTSRDELEDRRRYLEIVLGNISAGVISTDPAGRITTLNHAAAALIGIARREGLGRALVDVFPPEARGDVTQMVSELLDEAREAQASAVERQIEVGREGAQAAVLMAGTPLVAENGKVEGVVLFLEDVTHLLRVQRMEAWREVARRIAHEIKNPLTPIQLSAQRLRKRYAAQLQDDGGVFDECTRTIIQQVDDLKTLVNEFATFARLPRGEQTPQDLNRLVDEAIVLFREGHPDISFEFTPAAALPVIDLDREGVKRVLINVLDNGVAACQARARAAGEAGGRIELKTVYDGQLAVVRVEIADDGVGMTADVKARLGEPYFSTKADGTGLGLAIVSEVVADHNGFVRVRDNQPHGSRFIIEFPARRQAALVAARGRRDAYAG